jgi:hypothetical protein
VQHVTSRALYSYITSNNNNNDNNNRFIATTIITTMLTIIEHTDFKMDFGLHFHLNPPSLKLHVKFPLVHSTSGIMYYCMR